MDILKRVCTDSQVSCMARHDNKLVCGFVNGEIKVLDLVNFEWVLELEAHTLGVNDVLLDMFSDYFFTCSDDAHIKAWDWSGTLCFDLIGHTDYIQKLCVDLKNCVMLSGGEDRSVVLWDLRNQAEINTFHKVHQEGITSLDFSPDSSVFLTGSLDGTIHLWDTMTCDSLLTIAKSRKSPVGSARFISDGTYILNSCLDNSIYLWEVETTRSLPIRTYRGHLNESYRCSSWIDSDWKIWSGSENGWVHRWDLDTETHEVSVKLASETSFVYGILQENDRIIYTYYDTQSPGSNSICVAQVI